MSPPARHEYQIPSSHYSTWIGVSPRCVLVCAKCSIVQSQLKLSRGPAAAESPDRQRQLSGDSVLAHRDGGHACMMQGHSFVGHRLARPHAAVRGRRRGSPRRMLPWILQGAAKNVNAGPSTGTLTQGPEPQSSSETCHFFDGNRYYLARCPKASIPPGPASNPDDIQVCTRARFEASATTPSAYPAHAPLPGTPSKPRPEAASAVTGTHCAHIYWTKKETLADQHP